MNTLTNQHTLHLYSVAILSMFIQCVYIYLSTDYSNTEYLAGYNVSNQPFCTLLCVLYAIHVFYERSTGKSCCVLFLEMIEYRVMTFYDTS